MRSHYFLYAFPSALACLSTRLSVLAASFRGALSFGKTDHQGPSFSLSPPVSGLCCPRRPRLQHEQHQKLQKLHGDGLTLSLLAVPAWQGNIEHNTRSTVCVCVCVCVNSQNLYPSPCANLAGGRGKKEGNREGRE